MSLKLRKFLRDTTGAVAFETIVITPILAWTLVGSFVFFDAFRTFNSSLKATFSVADFFSRQTRPITPNDVEGLSNVFETMTRNPAGGSIRVSLIEFTGTDHEVVWSEGSDTETCLRDNVLQSFADEGMLPPLAAGERVYLVESFTPYRPYFDMGLANQDFDHFSVTRPRGGAANPMCPDCGCVRDNPLVPIDPNDAP